MVKAICDNCKFYREMNEKRQYGICMNPLNDSVYDHFNPTTGETILNIRMAGKISYDGFCYEWTQKEQGKKQGYGI